MHLLELFSQVEAGPHDILPPGRYISTDLVAAQLLLMADGGAMTPLADGRPFDRDADWNGRGILLQRAGGFGDLILLTPVLREIKRRWPGCRLGISTMHHYGVVLANLPYVDEILQFPVPLAVAHKFDAWIFYENAIEKNPRAEELHMTKLFAEIAGIEVPGGSLLPEYRVKPSEAIWSQEAYPRGANGSRRAAIQVGTSGRARRYPMFGEVARDLIERGWEVMLLGEKGELPSMEGKKLNPLLRNLTEAGLTFRQSAAVVNIADIFIGADSALLHVAGALGVPAVGLYGPFPWKLRTAHCPTTVALSGNGKCAPCFHHASGTMRNHFPAGCPSAQKNVCEVLASIKPERVVAKAEQIARRIW